MTEEKAAKDCTTTNGVTECVIDSGCITINVAIVHDHKIKNNDYEVTVYPPSKKIIPSKTVTSTFKPDQRKYAEFKVRQTHDNLTITIRGDSNGPSNRYDLAPKNDHIIVFNFKDCETDETDPPPETPKELDASSPS